LTSHQPPFITRANLFALAFFAVFIFLLYQMARLLAPFSAALLWAVIITLALHPLHQRVLRLLKGRPGIASAVMTLITLLAVIGPAVTVLVVFAGQAVDLYQSASQGISSGKFFDLWNRLSASLSENMRMLPFLSEIDVTGLAVKGLGEISRSLAGQIGFLLNETLILTINLAVMLVALFFFFRDGESYLRSIMDMLPFAADHKQSISRKVHATFIAVINGVFLIALLQGVMTGIGFALFGIPFSVFWGLIAAVLAVLPVGGAALVWIPGVFFLFFTGSKISSILFCVWGLVLVTLPDNFLKPCAALANRGRSAA
jgi:predicted PurR-regulated permease PerM